MTRFTVFAAMHLFSNNKYDFLKLATRAGYSLKGYSLKVRG